MKIGIGHLPKGTKVAVLIPATEYHSAESFFSVIEKIVQSCPGNYVAIGNNASEVFNIDKIVQIIERGTGSCALSKTVFTDPADNGASSKQYCNPTIKSDNQISIGLFGADFDGDFDGVTVFAGFPSKPLKLSKECRLISGLLPSKKSVYLTTEPAWLVKHLCDKYTSADTIVDYQYMYAAFELEGMFVCVGQHDSKEIYSVNKKRLKAAVKRMFNKCLVNYSLYRQLPFLYNGLGFADASIVDTPLGKAFVDIASYIHDNDVSFMYPDKIDVVAITEKSTLTTDITASEMEKLMNEFVSDVEQNSESNKIYLNTPTGLVIVDNSI